MPFLKDEIGGRPYRAKLSSFRARRIKAISEQNILIF